MAFWTVDDFSGSMTDFYIGEDKSCYEQAENLLVDEYKKLVSRPASQLDFTSSLSRARVPASVSTRRIGLMMPQTLGTSKVPVVLKQCGEKLHYDTGSTMAELLGPASNSAFAITSAITSETSFAFAEWNNHTIITHESPFQKPVKVYNDSGGVLRLRTAGLPIPGSAFTATGGANGNYIYALVFKYTYTVGSIQFVDLSTPRYKEFTNIGTNVPNTDPNISLAAIDVLANTNGEHYDTSNVKVDVYRTTNDGTVLYFVSEINNGTTVLTDHVTDEALVNNAELYTTGGVVANDRPPKCKYVHGTTDFVYYANAVEVSPNGADLEQQPQRLYQSKRGDPDSVPSDFFADMEEAISGVGSVKSIPVVFCENSIYRIDGFFDELGRGGMIPKKIADKIGGVGHLSIIQTLEGIFFAGSDGFYFTDGYQVVPLSERFKITYKHLVDTDLKRKRLCGAFEPEKKLVIWGTHHHDEGLYSTENSRLFVLDLGKKAFTTGGSGFVGTPDLSATVSTSGSTVTMADTTAVQLGDHVVIQNSASSLSVKAYVVAKVNGTTLTISHSAGTQTSVQADFIRNSVLTAYFYKNFQPTSMLQYNRTLWIGDAQGFTRKLNDDTTGDPWLDPAGSPITFDSSPIYFDYKSVAHSMGSTNVRKWTNYLNVKARPRADITSKLSLQPRSENDDDGNPDDLLSITFDEFYPWGTPLLNYGDPRLYQHARTLVDVKRRFPKNRLRCEYRQIHIAMGFGIIERSSTLALADILTGPDAVTKYLQLVGTNTWATDVFDYWISFDDDDYTANYRIVNRATSNKITLLDPAGDLTVSAGKKWVMRGFPKTALVNLLEYSIDYELLGPSQQPYGGENAVSQ